MKKYSITFLLLISILFGACFLPLSLSANQAQAAAEKNYILNDYLTAVQNPKPLVQNFGSPTGFIHMDSRISVNITYPKTDIAFLDEAISAWVEQLADEYISTNANQTTTTDPAELSVSYESCIITKNIVSIKLNGTFCASHLPYPTNITKTFLVDIHIGSFLSLEDILKESSLQEFTDLVLDRANLNANPTESSLFTNAHLTNNGIEILLDTWDKSTDTQIYKTLFFPYEEIAPLMQPDFLQQLIQPNSANDTTPTQTPNPPAIDPTKPMIALTFDDGPSAHTDRLLDIFNKYGGSGTFFVVGNLIDNRPDTLKRIANEGHEIANHSWSHRQLTTLSEKEIIDQIMLTRAKIYQVTGIDCQLVRPPYGAYNNTVKKVGIQLDVTFINWSVDPLDWKNRNVQAVYDAIISHASDGAIILCHDLHGTTVDAMEYVIPKLLNEGYQLVTVSQLMSYSQTPMEAGNLYRKQ